jgi:2-keto-3-deoxy-6-phosphogluconate aldolase
VLVAQIVEHAPLARAKAHVLKGLAALEVGVGQTCVGDALAKLAEKVGGVMMMSLSSWRLW